MTGGFVVLHIQEDQPVYFNVRHIIAIRERPRGGSDVYTSEVRNDEHWCVTESPSEIFRYMGMQS